MKKHIFFWKYFELQTPNQYKKKKFFLETTFQLKQIIFQEKTSSNSFKQYFESDYWSKIWFRQLFHSWRFSEITCFVISALKNIHFLLVDYTKCRYYSDIWGNYFTPHYELEKLAREIKKMVVFTHANPIKFSFTQHKQKAVCFDVG